MERREASPVAKEQARSYDSTNCCSSLKEQSKQDRSPGPIRPSPSFEDSPLPFSDVPILGRAEELVSLQNQIGGTSRHCRVMRLSGPAGSGKTRLVREHSSTLPHICQGYGQYHQLRLYEPYSALAEALNELVAVFLASDADETLSDAVRQVLDPEDGLLLAEVVPRVAHLMGVSSDNQEQVVDSIAVHGPKVLLNRLKYVLRLFLRTVATAETPVLLILDNLQWADESSLDLLQSLLTDDKLQYVTFVGIQRNAVALNSDGSSMTSSKTERNQDFVLERFWKAVEQHQLHGVHEMKLSLLNADTIQDFCAQLLSLNECQVSVLAEHCFRVSQGNPLFLVEYLQYLRAKRLLRFSDFFWKWDDEKVSEVRFENIVDVIVERIKLQADHVQHLLTVVALCPIVDETLIASLLTDQSASVQIPQVVLRRKIQDFLQSVVDSGFLVQSVGTGAYNFTHDYVQSAALAVPTLNTKIANRFDCQALQRRIGEQLLLRHRESPLEAGLLYQATGQLNFGSRSISDKIEREKLALLNLQAAEKAITMAAFPSVLPFLVSTVELLSEEEKWGPQHYPTSLRVYTAYAEMAIYTENYTSGKRAIKEVLLNAKKLDDMMRLYFVLLDSLDAEKKHSRGLSVARAALAELGEPLPRITNRLVVRFAVMKVKRLLKSDNCLNSLMSMTAQYKIWAMRLLRSVHHHARQLQHHSHAALAVVQMVQLSCESGVNALTPTALSSFGALLCQMGDLSEGYHYCKLAQQIQVSYEFRELPAQTPCAPIVLFDPREPMSDVIEQVADSYQAGIETGDIEYAMNSANSLCQASFYSGKPLPYIEEDLRVFCDKMTEHGELHIMWSLAPYWQLVQNLMGSSSNLAKLQGDALDASNFQRTLIVRDNLDAYQSLWLAKGQACYYFGNMEGAYDEFKRFGASFNAVSHPYYCVYLLFSGLTCLELALTMESKKRKYLRKAIQYLKVMRKRSQSGAIIYFHRYLLLNAERQAVESTLKDDFEERKLVNEAQRAFDEAAQSAVEAGFLQDAALAKERAGVFLTRWNPAVGAEYLVQAYDLYTEWGAKAKADELERVHSILDVKTLNRTILTGSSVASSPARGIGEISFLNEIVGQ